MRVIFFLFTSDKWKVYIIWVTTQKLRFKLTPKIMHVFFISSSLEIVKSSNKYQDKFQQQFPCKAAYLKMLYYNIFEYRVLTVLRELCKIYLLPIYSLEWGWHKIFCLKKFCDKLRESFLEFLNKWTWCKNDCVIKEQHIICLQR